MKNDELLDHLDPLLPIDFFWVDVEIPKVEYPAKKWPRMSSHLPSLSPLLGEEPFAEVSLGWSLEGIIGVVEVKKPFEDSLFPDYAKSDSVEIWIDTRDNKKAGFASKFCHHFLFLAQPVQGIHSQEVTRFRSEDTHVLCDPADLTCEVELGKKDYSLRFCIPARSLCGYDPTVFARMGIAYRVNRYRGDPQHFSLSSRYFDMMQHPALWASATFT